MKTFIFTVTSKATGIKGSVPVWASCFGVASNAIINAYPKSQFNWSYDYETDQRFFTGISCD